MANFVLSRQKPMARHTMMIGNRRWRMVEASLFSAQRWRDVSPCFFSMLTTKNRHLSSLLRPDHWVARPRHEAKRRSKGRL
jgi:hypothetical protein